ncbi:MAG: metallophosphoesterase [Harvfovirus sp.]|uniref:Metallophosphoesterase n=1 Tax=Harvfovirus sp. TaxID=2487768 RepID=A0A3G5A3C6_9VIRU|nr:MAG: metallophosphoesterase [Harvfovirus sp.]
MPLIQVISDIHLEFIDAPKFEEIVVPAAPYLAICGDLGLPYLDSYDNFLAACSKNFTQVFLIAGNHEYYQWKRSSGETFTIDEVHLEIETIVKKYNNIHFLNNKSYILEDEFVILGTTLWSEIQPENYFNASYQINDFKHIYYSENKTTSLITPKYITEKFHENVNWLKTSINAFSDKKIIILTHHLPSFQLIHERFKTSKLNCCFASDLDYLMTDSVIYWLAGHTHCSFNIKINNTRCIVNPKGYYDENPSYDSSLTIQV